MKLDFFPHQPFAKHTEHGRLPTSHALHSPMRPSPVTFGHLKVVVLNQSKRKAQLRTVKCNDQSKGGMEAS